MVYTPKATICRGATFINYKWIELHQEFAAIPKRSKSNEFLPIAFVYHALMAIALRNPTWIAMMGMNGDEVHQVASQLHQLISSEGEYLGALRAKEDQEDVAKAEAIMKSIKPLALWELQGLLGLTRAERPNFQHDERPRKRKRTTPHHAASLRSC
jgi:hypothetical protein